MASLVSRLTRDLDLRLAAVHLVDSPHCADPFKFISAALVSLQAMVRLELPHVNVLSKADLRESFEKAGESPAEGGREGRDADPRPVLPRPPPRPSHPTSHPRRPRRK
jgi:hypothetical protein